MDRGGEINLLPARDISEPHFRHGMGGDREMVHPGNREFAKGDSFDRPQGGEGGGGEGEAGEGESVDQFTFSLSRRVPQPVLRRPGTASPGAHPDGRRVREEMAAGGLSTATTGSPSLLSVNRTLKASLSRRVALGMGARAKPGRS